MDIMYHDSLHGFRTGRGTSKITLEDKLLYQLTDMMEALLHTILLDIQKVYNALEWERCLDILVVYCVGPWTIRLLRTYWNHLRMVAKSGGYFGSSFQGYHGVTQG